MKTHCNSFHLYLQHCNGCKMLPNPQQLILQGQCLFFCLHVYQCRPLPLQKWVYSSLFLLYAIELVWSCSKWAKNGTERGIWIRHTMRQWCRKELGCLCQLLTSFPLEELVEAYAWNLNQVFPTMRDNFACPSLKYRLYFIFLKPYECF